MISFCAQHARKQQQRIKIGRLTGEDLIKSGTGLSRSAKFKPRERYARECQSAFKFDPGSASNFDPFDRRVLTVALASSELAGVAETWRARVA